MIWETSRRKLSLDRPLVMAVLNITPDSFSDGGEFLVVDDALSHAEKLIAEGADILDIGGESTRPGSRQVSVEEEVRRVVPVIEAVSKRFDTPLSVDTTRAAVAETAVEAGAEIINDISGLRFDAPLGRVAAKYNTGIVLMHSRGTFETMHSQSPVDDIMREVSDALTRCIENAKAFGIAPERIALDIGIGFSKTFDQNLELIAKLDKIADEFVGYPLVVGTSRKSFIGKILGDVPTEGRLAGSLASAAVAVWNGANIVRVHDVRATVDSLKVVEAIRNMK